MDANIKKSLRIWKAKLVENLKKKLESVNTCYFSIIPVKV